jgi:hypothetical protein
MIQIMFGESQVQVQAGSDGSKVLIALDPKSGIQVVLPMNEEAARIVSASLGSGLIVASALPAVRPF